MNEWTVGRSHMAERTLTHNFSSNQPELQPTQQLFQKAQHLVSDSFPTDCLPSLPQTSPAFNSGPTREIQMHSPHDGQRRAST